MKIERLGNAKTIISNPESYHNYFAWPTVTKLQNGRIAVVCSGFRVGHICPFGKAVIAFSDDLGETYTAPAPVIDTVLDDRDAGILAFGERNVLVTSFNIDWNTYLKGGYEEWYSPCEKYVEAYVNMISDETVAAEKASRFCISNDFGTTFGSKHRAPITSPHGPICLKDGSILWVGTNYCHGQDNVISAYKIYTDGRTEFLGRIEDCYEGDQKLDFVEPHAIELDDGTILCHIRTHLPGDMTIYQSKSTDGGRTWSRPHRILETKRSAPAYLMRSSSGLLISSYGFRGLPSGIRVMFSKDNGETWDTENIIFETETSKDVGYPATIELPNGEFLTVFYAHEVKGGPAVIMQQKWKLSE